MYYNVVCVPEGVVVLEDAWTWGKLVTGAGRGQGSLQSEVALEHGSLPQGQDTAHNRLMNEHQYYNTYCIMYNVHVYILQGARTTTLYMYK